MIMRNIEKTRVGREIRTVRDVNRYEQEIHENGCYEFPISIFYKANNSCCTFESQYSDLFFPRSEELTEFLCSGEFEREKLQKCKVNIFNEVPMEEMESALPLVIFSSGFTMYRDSITYLIEKLVERGYFVVTIGHAYEDEACVLPDGRIIEQSREIREGTWDSKSTVFWERLIESRKKDVLCTLEYLKDINKNDSKFKEKFALDKIYAIGFSLGGSTMLELLGEIDELKAGIILDGLPKKRSIRNIYKPCLVIRNGVTSREELYQDFLNYIEDKDMLNQEINTILKEQKLLFQILYCKENIYKLIGAEHITFTDAPKLYKDQLYNGIDISQAHEIIADTVIAFLDEAFLKLDQWKSCCINLTNVSGKIKPIDSLGIVKSI